jgi:phenylacetate-coenzyme A ligase PaaK-like adenylate-forming protein
MYNELKKAIFNVKSEKDFEALALEIYRYQYQRNHIYREFAQLMHKTPDKVHELLDIPFLPIAFFKSHKILSSIDPVMKTFSSSGTSGQGTSKHYVTDLDIYNNSFQKSFKKTFPGFEDASIIALLPSYIERSDSSLIYMIEGLIKNSKGKKSGFYQFLNEDVLEFLEKDKNPKILIGVSFALLNLAEKKVKLNNTKVIETGGMKGMRKELIRKELHDILKRGLNIQEVYSEYGMTELLSQGYLSKNRFYTPAWMKVLTREISDPLSLKTKEKGALNIIDLANINSCSFIATDDLGEVFSDGNFDVIGRIDHSLIRGCNLLI